MSNIKDVIGGCGAYPFCGSAQSVIIVHDSPESQARAESLMKQLSDDKAKRIEAMLEAPASLLVDRILELEKVGWKLYMAANACAQLPNIADWVGTVAVQSYPYLRPQ